MSRTLSSGVSSVSCSAKRPFMFASSASWARNTAFESARKLEASRASAAAGDDEDDGGAGLLLEGARGDDEDDTNLGDKADGSETFDGGEADEVEGEAADTRTGRGGEGVSAAIAAEAFEDFGDVDTAAHGTAQHSSVIAHNMRREPRKHTMTMFLFENIIIK